MHTLGDPEQHPNSEKMLWQSNLLGWKQKFDMSAACLLPRRHISISSKIIGRIKGFNPLLSVNDKNFRKHIQTIKILYTSVTECRKFVDWIIYESSSAKSHFICDDSLFWHSCKKILLKIFQCSMKNSFTSFWTFFTNIQSGP